VDAVDFEVLEETQPYLGKVINVHRDRVRLPNGNVSNLENIVHGPSTAIVPVLPDGRILLINQFRYPARGFILEIPAGVLKPGESPEECAKRELEEETGYVPGRMTYLGGFMLAPGYCDEVIHVFLARDLVPGKQELERSEVIDLAPYALTEVNEMIRDGRIADAKTVIGVLLAFRGELGC
jgi:ADP-ribose pyrophosphatase